MDAKAGRRRWLLVRMKATVRPFLSILKITEFETDFGTNIKTVQSFLLNHTVLSTIAL